MTIAIVKNEDKARVNCHPVAYADEGFTLLCVSKSMGEVMVARRYSQPTVDVWHYTAEDPQDMTWEFI